MAYRISYKVVSEQGNALKQTAKDMGNYITQLNKIVKNLGNDELLKGARDNLKAFEKQLEDEKAFLNLAGQVLVDVVQAYTSTEKKNVSRVDKAKAHNRDFYKRPVAVASAGAVAVGAGATASNVNTVNTVNNVNKSYTTVYNNSPAPSGTASTTANEPTTVVYQESNTTNVYVTEASPMMDSAPFETETVDLSMDAADFASAAAPVADGATASDAGANIAALGAGALLTAGGVIAGSALNEFRSKNAEDGDEMTDAEDEDVDEMADAEESADEFGSDESEE